MKNILIIICLFLFQNVFAIEKIYLQQPTPYNTFYQRPVYNPYSNMYYNPYRYKRTNYNDIKRMQRIRRIRNLNRIKNNVLSWNFNRNNQGNLTGYSVPINQNIYNQMNFDDLEKYNKLTPSCNTPLFSSPMGNNSYYRNGQFLNKNGGVSSNTGVRIIYD